MCEISVSPLRNWAIAIAGSFLVMTIPDLCLGGVTEALSSHVSIRPGPVNGVAIEQDGRMLVVYGDPEQSWKAVEIVLFTHARRDVVWAGRTPVDGGAESVVPAGEAEQFSKAQEFWSAFWDKRFHDYAQQSTRVPVAPMQVGRTVREGDRISWRELKVHVLDTPGYTRGAVSYLVEIDGLRYAFVGDLIYGDGRIMDLYSLQDAVAQARIGGYHGYAGRIGDLIASLRKVAAQKPDLLVPARGPVIREPAVAIERLIRRLQAAYENYLSISAGRWYFHDPYDVLAARALGVEGKVSWMPYAATIEKTPPDWIVPIHNSRLVLAHDKSGFLIDCGSTAIIEELRKLRDQGHLTSIEGLFITHYHDDHTDRINDFLRDNPCPAYVTPVMEDVTRRPGDYRLPAMTANAIDAITVVPDGHRMAWKEFTLTFHDFPGQTIYHSALLVEQDTGEKIFFVGDSFTPSGLDDYCMQNRNLLRPGEGYLRCLDLLQHTIPPDALLINEHVLEPFRFDAGHLKHMESVFIRRAELLRELFPWDEPNYGIDEQWVRIHPYGQEAQAGRWANLAVKILNHSPAANTFTVTLNAPQGCEIEPARASIAASAGQEVEIPFKLRVGDRSPGEVCVLTADIQVGPWDLRQWCEAIVKVVP
ncbi:MAG TPA: MBL fold metallo-hydrolase [Sedimentisphaerales bacterium]|nr:MBL fold metallo-hydrolase [Sedimentisphaerales bacterium]HNU29968.1 MBL fold metallo-hydrolase [Sedimentisphaerales bacterium]